MTDVMGWGSLTTEVLIGVRVVYDGGIVCGVNSPFLLECDSETVAFVRKRTCFGLRRPIVSGVVVGSVFTMFEDQLYRLFMVLC